MQHKIAVIIHDVAQGDKGPMPVQSKAAGKLHEMFGCSNPRSLFAIDAVFKRRQELKIDGEYAWDCMVARARLHTMGYFKSPVVKHDGLPIIVYGWDLWIALRAQRRSGCDYTVQYFDWKQFDGRWWMMIPHYSHAFWSSRANVTNAAWYGMNIVVGERVPWQG